jgi:hypothetical protein
MVIISMVSSKGTCLALGSEVKQQDENKMCKTAMPNLQQVRIMSTLYE